jgi:3-isopropylmalate/(R)-2-methylmalate dehydratase small subunit
MQPFTTLTAVAAPLDIAKLDTGMIVPGRFQRLPRRAGHNDYAQVFLHDLRFDANEQPRAAFVLNQPAYQNAGILVTGPDFGCGSSRESAAYATLDFGVRALIGASFGDVYRGNCMQNGVLTIALPPTVVNGLIAQLQATPGAVMTVDLLQQTVIAPDGTAHAFDIDATRKERLLKGLDDVGVTLQHLPQIEAFEARYRADMPWLKYMI